MFWELATLQGGFIYYSGPFVCKTEKVTTCERARKTSQHARSYGGYGVAAPPPQICVFAPQNSLDPKNCGWLRVCVTIKNKAARSSDCSLFIGQNVSSSLHIITASPRTKFAKKVVN